MRVLLNIIVIMGVLIPIHAWSPVLAQSSDKPLQEEAQVPDHVIYEFYFRRLAFYDELAAKKDSLDDNHYQFLIRNELGIDENQRIIISRIGSESLAQAATLDAKAASIIQRERSRYPEGKLPGNFKAPDYPLELKKLQASRVMIFANAKTQLSKGILGTDYQRIDARIRAIIMSTLSIRKIK